MTQVEQTKEQYMEVINDILDHIFKKLKQENVNKAPGEIVKNTLDYLKENPDVAQSLKVEGEKLSPSEIVRKTLDYLKDNPNVAKPFLQKIVANDIRKNYESFKENNRQSLEKISQIKRTIDISTDKGKELFNNLNLIEKKLMDKDKHVEKMAGKLLNEKVSQKVLNKEDQEQKKENGYEREIEQEQELEIE